MLAEGGNADDHSDHGDQHNSTDAKRRWCAD